MSSSVPEHEIKEIEDLSLNAWPSHQIQIYDGWLLRFSYFYTHRTNSVEQIGKSSIPVDEKIGYCEQEYKKWGTPAVFKITPLLDAGFDGMLEERGYHVEHHTDVMTMDLEQPGEAEAAAGSACAEDGNAPLPLSVGRFISDSWIEGLFALKNTTNVMHRQVVPSMYRAIPKQTVCVSVQDGGRIIATGLGILDRRYVGVYAIHVHPDYRRMHLGSRIVNRILQEGRAGGAGKAYLQVVHDNLPAVEMYAGIGFRKAYEYYFRVRQV